MIPIILHPCGWLMTPLKELQGVPRDNKAISLWANEHAAFDHVLTEIAKVVDDLLRSKTNREQSSQTSAVAIVASTPWVCTMHGNVWEWVEDVWHDSYSGAPADGSPWMEGEGVNSERSRVVRGGCWVMYPRYCRSASRYKYVPGNRVKYLGFRVARTLGQILVTQRHCEPVKRSRQSRINENPLSTLTFPLTRAPPSPARGEGKVWCAPSPRFGRGSG